MSRQSLNRQKSQDKTMRKSVRFSCHQSEIKHFSNHGYCDANSWYSKSEYEDIKYGMSRDVRTVVNKIKSKDMIEISNEYQIIGIEKLVLRSMFEETRRKRLQHINAVLEEQERQDTLLLCDPMALCIVSRAHSQWSREMAHRTGCLVYELE